jgi:preflagellin peptidase FlaK
VLAGVLYPLALAARNGANGEFALPMFLGKRVDADSVGERYGTLMGRNDGMDAGSLDLDALRMYLQWRGETLEGVRSNASDLRHPDSLPDSPNDPGDGNVDSDRDVATTGDSTATDGGGQPPMDADSTSRAAASGDHEGPTDEDVTAATSGVEYDDAWGAEAFLDDIEGDAYGTSPDALRAGLDVLASARKVWVSPGIPFIVPMFAGLVVALAVGDLVTVAIGLV